MESVGDRKTWLSEQEDGEGNVEREPTKTFQLNDGFCGDYQAFSTLYLSGFFWLQDLKSFLKFIVAIFNNFWQHLFKMVVPPQNPMNKENTWIQKGSQTNLKSFSPLN